MTDTLTPGAPSTGDPGEDCGVRGGCRACPLFQANVCGDPAPEPTTPVCVQTRTGVIPCGTSVHCTSRETVAAIREAQWEVANEGYEPPDVDPNEPQPEGAGCCGGACGA